MDYQVLPSCYRLAKNHLQVFFLLFSLELLKVRSHFFWFLLRNIVKRSTKL
jgi:hypothetical protein